MENLDIKTISEMGGIGIAILMIWYSAWKDKMFNRTLNNHLRHNEEAINDNKEAINKLTNMIDKLIYLIERRK